MMTIKTYVANSTVCDSLGLFSKNKVTAGTVIWSFVEGFDVKVHVSNINKLLLPQREYIDSHFWREGDYLYSSCDNSNFQNHSSNPNSVSRDNVMIALRDIEADEEILVDYSKFDDDWSLYSESAEWAK